MLLINNYPSIVTLHYVSDDASLDKLKPWVINYNSFSRFLDFIEREGYTTYSFEEIANGGKIVDKSIIITFDDCPKHLWDFAIPELQRRNMKAVFYFSTAYIDGYNEWNIAEGLPAIKLMDEADIKRLVDIGMEVGSHSHHHVMLEEQEEDFVISELVKSKLILETITKKEIVSLAYPYGSVPRIKSSTIENIGYKSAVSVYTFLQDNYKLRRWVYDDNDTNESIKAKLSYLYRWQRSISDKKNVVTKALLSTAYRFYIKAKSLVTSCFGFIVFLFEDVQLV